MVIENFPEDFGGPKMYGVTFDLDIHALEDELHVPRSTAYAEIEKALASIGYKHIQYSVYVCPEPRNSEIQVVHDTIMVLKKLPWYSEAVSRIIAFEIGSWGDITGAFKED